MMWKIAASAKEIRNGTTILDLSATNRKIYKARDKNVIREAIFSSMSRNFIRVRYVVVPFF